MGGRPCLPWLILWLLPLLILSGCSGGDSLENRFDDYEARLARVLDLDYGPEPSPEPLPFPSRRSLQLTLQDLRIDWLEFFALSDCDLSRVVGERNSSLGKVMAPSQQWLYERELLRALAECRQKREAEGEMEAAARLADIETLKRRDYPLVIWNATWASPEYQSLLSTRGGALNTTFRLADHAELTATLSRLRELAEQESRQTDFTRTKPPEDIEALNQSLVSAPAIGALWVSLELASARMARINNALQERLARRPLCPSGKPVEAARFLKNVLLNVYAPQVQNPLAELQRANQRWRPLLAGQAASQVQALATLEQQSAATGGSRWSEWRQFHERFLDARSTLETELRQELRRHARLMSDTLHSCGLPLSLVSE